MSVCHSACPRDGRSYDRGAVLIGRWRLPVEAGPDEVAGDVDEDQGCDEDDSELTRVGGDVTHGVNERRD